MSATTLPCYDDAENTQAAKILAASLCKAPRTMNVTHRGKVYTARQDGNLVRIEPQPEAALYICSLCGAEGASPNEIPHGPNCPEAAQQLAERGEKRRA